MKENYCVFQTVICGADHVEKHELRRDYADCYENEKVKIVVAAGGRNDKPYIRSFIGASLAAKVTLEAARIFAAGVDEKKLLTDVEERERMLRQLEGSIITRWQDAVKEHLNATPFFTEEIEGIGEDAAFEKYKKAYQEGKNIEYAYSASITAVIITENYTIALRNGNGDCAFIEATGAVREPLLWNEKCQGSYCTSFCDRTAIQEFRHAVISGKPKLAVVATDGLRKCFENKEQLYKYITDFWKKIDWKSVLEQNEEIQFQPAQADKIRDDVAIAAVGMDWSEIYRLEQEKIQQAERKKKLQEERNLKDKKKAESQPEIKTEQPEKKTQAKKQVKPQQKNNRLFLLIAAVAVVALAVKLFGSSGAKPAANPDTTAAYEETSELEQATEETTWEETTSEETTEEEVTEEETTIEETTPEETVPPEPETEAPTSPPTTAAPPPTQPPTTAAPPPTQPPTTAAPPPTQPPTTAAPPPTEPPTTAPPPTTASPTLPGPAIIW